MRSVAFRCLTLIGATVLAACGATPNTAGRSDRPTAGGSYTIANCEPQHLTPQNEVSSCGAQVFQGLWTRLTEIDPKTGAAVPAQAESIDVSADGLTYTIRIRPGWTFHNGEAVTADSYVDAWNFGAYGPNGNLRNSFFASIEGYDALNPLKGKPSTNTLSGLEVLGETMFRVTLSAPVSSFQQLLSFDAFDPLPAAFFADPEAFDEHPVGDGPYMMSGPWQHDVLIELERYDDYAGALPLADRVSMLLYQGYEPLWLAFRAGDVDITLIGPSNLPEAQSSIPDQVLQAPGGYTEYLNLPLWDERFVDARLRQALSMAIDRDAILASIAPGERPADDFAVPTMIGYRPGACTFCVFDPEGARTLLEAAGGWRGEMVISYAAYDLTVQQVMEAIGAGWTDVLGIQVSLNPIEVNSWYDYMASRGPQGPFFDGVSMDVRMNSLAVLYGTNGPYNMSTYSNPAFDSAMKDGDIAVSISEGMSAYQAGVDLLAQDMPSIPLAFYDSYFVFSADVSGLEVSIVTGAIDLSKVVAPADSGA